MKRFFSTIVFTASIAVMTHAQTTYREWIDVADKDFEKGKYTTAIASYTKAIQLSPANADAFMYRAIAKSKNGDDEGAAIDFTNVLRIQPNNAKAYSLRSDTKLRRNDLQGALFDINQAIKINPKEVAYLQQRSKVSEKMGLLAQSQADLEEIKKINASANDIAEIEPKRRIPEEPSIDREPDNGDEEVAIVKTKGPKLEQRKEQRKTDLKVEEKSANNFNEPEPNIKKDAPKPKPVVKVEKPKEEPKPVVKVEKPKEEPKPVVKVEKPKEEPKPVVKVETPKEEPKPVVKVETPKEEPKPVVKVEKPKEEPKPVVKVETPKEEPKPVVKVETPKEEPKPVVKVETPKEEPKPVVKVETPKEEPKPTVKTDNNDNEIIIVDGVKQYKNGTIIGRVELEPTGGMSLQKEVAGGQPRASFRDKQSDNTQKGEASNNKENASKQKVQNDTKSPLYTPTPAQNTTSTVADAAVAARPNAKAELSSNTAPVAPRAPAAEIQRSMFLEARRMARADNHKGAIEQLDKLIALDPNNAASYINRAISKSALEDFEGALKDFDEAIKVAPNMPEIYYNRANVFFDTKRYQDAIDGYSEALNKNKDYTQAYLNRALAKRAMGGVYDPCSDWKAAAALGSEKAKKMMDTFCEDSLDSNNEFIGKN